MNNKKNLNIIVMILVVIVFACFYINQGKSGVPGTESSSGIISEVAQNAIEGIADAESKAETEDATEGYAVETKVEDKNDSNEIEDDKDYVMETVDDDTPEMSDSQNNITEVSDTKSESAAETKSETEPAAETKSKTEPAAYTSADLKGLKHTEHFSRSLIEHIFMGTINSKGNATGYHYDGITDSPGKIIEGTKGSEDENGVYIAQIEVDGIAKISNRGRSSFYPENMTPQDVVDAINEAYDTRQEIDEDKYEGETSRGFLIQMYINDNGKITTAFPIYEK